jgi:hypothetical protein
LRAGTGGNSYQSGISGDSNAMALRDAAAQDISRSVEISYRAALQSPGGISHLKGQRIVIRKIGQELQFQRQTLK